MTVADLSPAQLGGLDLLDGAPFQSGAGWWRAVAATAIPDGSRPRFLAVERDGRPVLLLPMLAGAGGRSSALVTPYTCLYQPAGALAELEAAAEALARHLGPVLRIDAADGAWAGWQPLLRGFRRAGYRATTFASFGNWVEPLCGRKWEAYLAARPGALRETVRRRTRRAAGQPCLVFGVAGPGQLEEYLDAYERVYARSWKGEEPFPDFTAAFVAEAARAGVLRIAVLRRDGVPLAAQYWTVEHGVATVLKLAHVEAARSHSPGTVLTAWMIRRLIEVEGVAALDFGRGDDPYKRDWATVRRQRSGFVIADPRRVAGLSALLRQAGGRWARRLRG